MVAVLTPVPYPARHPSVHPEEAALEAVDAVASPEARARAAAAHLHVLGFPQVVITLRDAALHPTMAVTAGNPDLESRSSPLHPLPPAVWRRYLPQLERFRVDGGVAGRKRDGGEDGDHCDR